MSSDEEIMRKGRQGRKSTLLMPREWPVNSPRSEPVSHITARIKRPRPSPQMAIRLLSLSHMRSRISRPMHWI